MNEIQRVADFPETPDHLKQTVRTSRIYYQLTLWFRAHPPIDKTFRLRDIAKHLGIEVDHLRGNLNNYRRDSLLFLKYCPIPTDIKTAEEGWRYMLGRLHRFGFYYIQPSVYHSREWLEPTFRQAEDYNSRYFGEGLHRIQTRLEMAITHDFEINGINVRRELEATVKKREMLEGQEFAT